jgi:hypothetical protein
VDFGVGAAVGEALGDTVGDADGMTVGLAEGDSVSTGDAAIDGDGDASAGSTPIANPSSSSRFALLTIQASASACVEMSPVTGDPSAVPSAETSST